MKDINTLIPDIYDVLEGKGGWDAAVSDFFRDNVEEILRRMEEGDKPRDYLGLSSVGTPCKRKLWYQINQTHLMEPLSAEALGTFKYGDILEAFVLSLAKAAGHTVEGMQEKHEVFGIPGHTDAIIDGWVVDVKSASRFGFEKFKKNGVKEDDPFGYISQLSSYLYALKDDPRVHQKSMGAFLVVQKDRFKLCLDAYDLAEELANKEAEIEATKSAVAGKIPDRHYSDEPQIKTSPNRKLGVACSYCNFRKECWPNARTFLYSTGPVHLTKVVKRPKETIKEVP